MSEEKKIFDSKLVHFIWSDELKGKEGFIAPTIGRLVDYVENNVRTNQWQKFEESHSTDLPFHSLTGPDYGFAYYDPLYEVKWAWKNGKTIQFRLLDDEWRDCNNEPTWDSQFEYRVKSEALYVHKASDDTLHINTSSTFAILPPEFKGTKNGCKQYIKEHYCDRCVHQCCDIKMDEQFCKGFKEAKSKRRMTNRELAKWLMHGNGQVKHRDGNYILNTYNAYDVHDDNKPCPNYLVVRGWDETEWHEPEVEV